ncbi:ABC transporter ATP-binding protein [Thermopolyspora flexuosa]|jgi:ABC-type multidrug transport system ATPase subunit|uniref:ABC-2 type transport system ATP-binding protein n=1 Tax=Thermopolyspora flexuosa TaxID=103836 RepID=A0A543IV94_9ACTN|nr:ABC transporter ATP-binding protein [Thermopolyspora flexuosa]TQM74489.1 ABC-2 type transport system ATP-binding protein [Thermopolyspora flexuosa]GGM76502.1 ABC transporter ATP-binding protein [Thermopolyspora flexuosa]
MAHVAYNVSGLSKTFPKQRRPANDDLTFEIHEGEIFGLLGDNGAGKTTLVRQLVNLLRPDRGTIELFGRDVAKDPGFVTMTVGYMPQRGSALNRLTVAEALYLTAHLRGLSRRQAAAERDHLLELLRLTGIRNRSSDRLSGGQRRLVQLAVALAGRPPVLILDEPTNELDPANRRYVWDVLRDWNERHRTTIVLITHDAIEAERVIERVGIMREGRFVALGRPSDLKRAISPRRHVALSFLPGKEPALPDGIVPWRRTEDTWWLTVDHGRVPELLAALDFTTVTDIRLHSATLEDLYLHYVS